MPLHMSWCLPLAVKNTVEREITASNIQLQCFYFLGPTTLQASCSQMNVCVLSRFLLGHLISSVLVCGDGGFQWYLHHEARSLTYPVKMSIKEMTSSLWCENIAICKPATLTINIRSASTSMLNYQPPER